MSVLVVAEKPAVARDIAQVLGARTRGDGHFAGAGWIVTWAIGHLVALAEPHEMNPAWKAWRMAELPMVPERWPLVVGETTRDQFAVVRRLMNDASVTRVVCATDAGREGELIFRYIYEAARCKKPVQRLWISSLTPEAIASGFRALQPGTDFEGLADAARGRSRADWLVGMNLSRAYSLLHDEHFSVGRVQTPTLAIIVAREKEIRDFVPEDYLEVVAVFAPPGSAEKSESYVGTYVAPEGREPARLPADGEEAGAIVERARTGNARVRSVDRKTRRLPPPQLYDLTELQRHANRLYGFTAQRTLQCAQRLYEERKLLSYPRTGSRHLSRAVASELPGVVAAIEEPYRGMLAAGTGEKPLGPRFVDDARVTDHHAIIPTGKKAPGDLPPDERKLYDLVCRRLLSAWHGDHVQGVTTVITTITAGTTVDRYLSTGISVEEQGWRVLDIVTSSSRAARGKEADAPSPKLPGGLAPGQVREVASAKALAKQTRPPPRFTDATLLTMMETAGRLVDEKELSQAMRDCGLGTPATRAAIIETLLNRDYIVRQEKAFAATEKGIALVEVVHPHVKSPAMTGEWEAKLARIERGEETLEGFTQAIERFVREVVGNVAREAPASASGAMTPASASGAMTPASVPGAMTPASASGAMTPASASGAMTSTHRRIEDRPRELGRLLRDAFGFETFRPYQEEVCRAAASGRDVLLVMPTGAGKSLCYQLPGLARGGTTLVISPLVALMEDQVAQLQRRGFAAERIHSGRPRTASREACRAYLAGALDFLFIAPERLAVPGFPEMLARRKPTLIAIDEAHCISQWGHDFRPDYRMLGERLPLLRPAPVIALTATATPTVQEDIVSELRLEAPARFIHGFRRTNIGVEVVERSAGERPAMVRALLHEPSRVPAIVYAPTRAEAEKLAEALAGKLRVAAYHAGMPSRQRDDVQGAFLTSKLDVIIATTAFGMGIDKPDVRTVVHTALPSSIEGYYQEIGRAGRDGAASRAVLIHSFVDMRTHAFFHERDYPEAEILAKVQAAIPAQGAVPEKIAKKTRLEADVVEKAIEKLWVHGGALVDGENNVRRGEGDWRKPYLAQREHKREQLERMRRFAETPSCRMLQLVAHFGDQKDARTPCGACDVCLPAASIALAFREASPLEQRAATAILEALAERDGRSVGQLLREVFGEGSLDRRSLDHVLGALARSGAVKVVEDAFEKDGKSITFQRVWLTRADGSTAAPLRVLVTPPPKVRGASGRRARTAPTRGRKTKAAPAPSSRSRGGSRTAVPVPSGGGGGGGGLEASLREWRAVEAKKRRAPAFRVLTDRTLVAIAASRPATEAELLALPGMGAALLAKYGKAILGVVRSAKR